MVVQKKQLARILSLCEDTVSNAALPSHTTLVEIVSRALAIPYLRSVTCFMYWQNGLPCRQNKYLKIGILFISRQTRLYIYIKIYIFVYVRRQNPRYFSQSQLRILFMEEVTHSVRIFSGSSFFLQSTFVMTTKILGVQKQYFS